MSAASKRAPLDALLDRGAAGRPARAMSAHDVLAACGAPDAAALVYERLTGRCADDDSSRALRQSLSPAAHASAAIEAVRTREVTSVLAALGARAIQPILIKGTPLAHTVYDSPAARSREDTDLLIARAQVDDVRRCMRTLGYAEALLSGGELLFCQFQVMRRDALGIDHAFDFHWKISTQSLFADLLTYDELTLDAVPVPALGASARAAGRVHALLLACIHPVMHHRNAERLVWLLDIHLLILSLSPPELKRFVAMAIEKEVAAICAHQIARCRVRFGTPRADEVIAALAAGGPAEPSAIYLRPLRRWRHELASNLRGLPRLSDRLRLLREVLLPGRRYMLAAYGLSDRARPLLPALYLLRTVSGLWRVVAGRK